MSMFKTHSETEMDQETHSQQNKSFIFFKYVQN